MNADPLHAVAAAYLTASLSLAAAAAPKWPGVALFYTILLAYKVALVTTLPHATSWCILLGEWDPYAAAAAFSGYPLAAAAALQARRLGVPIDGAPHRFALAAVLGAALGAAVRGTPCPPEAYALTALTWSVYGGVAEELYFRGTLLQLLEKRLGRTAAVAAQAIAFGLSHPWSVGAVAAAALLGVALGLIRPRLGLRGPALRA